jgi:hypothetical protein
VAGRWGGSACGTRRRVSGGKGKGRTARSPRPGAGLGGGGGVGEGLVRADPIPWVKGKAGLTSAPASGRCFGQGRLYATVQKSVILRIVEMA